MIPLLFAVVDAVLNGRVVNVGEAHIAYLEFVPAFKRAMDTLGWWRSTW